MELDNGTIWLLILGIFFTLFGGFVLLSDRFLGGLKKSFWKDDEIDKRDIGEKNIHLFDRFGRGLSAFLLGIVFLGCYIAIRFSA